MHRTQNRALRLERQVPVASSAILVGQQRLRAIKGWVVPGLLGLLTACATLDTASYRARLLDSLSNQREISYSDEAVYPGGVLCGRYEALGVDGFTPLRSDFIVTPTRVMNRPRAEQKLVYCNEDPQAALYQEFGIGGEQNWSSLAQVRDDMTAIDLAINAYYKRYYRMPQSLDKLLEDDFGVSESDLQDPWERRYRYEPGLAGRTTPQYTLQTYGADNRKGGTDNNADISRAELPMVAHVLQLQE